MDKPKDYKLCVYDTSGETEHLVDTPWEGNDFCTGGYELEYTYNRIAGLVRIGELKAGTTRIVLMQYDGTVEKEITA